MRKLLTATGVLGAAFVLPLMSGGTAYAADTASIASLDTSAVVDVVKAGGGCTTTYVSDLEANHLGPLYSISGLNVTVNGNNASAYASATTADTSKYEKCMV